MPRAHLCLLTLALGALLTLSGCEQLAKRFAPAPQWQAYLVSGPVQGAEDAAREERRVVEPGARVVAEPGMQHTLMMPGGGRLVLEQGSELRLGDDKTPSVALERGGVSVSTDGSPLNLMLSRVTLELHGDAQIARQWERYSVTLQRGRATLRSGKEEHELAIAQPMRVEADGTLVKLPALGLEQPKEETLEGGPRRALSGLCVDCDEEGSDPLGVLYDPARQSEVIERQHLKVSASIHGPAATTEIEEEFLNLSDEPVEMTYAFSLPPGALLTGLEVRVGHPGNNWHEAFISESDEVFQPNSRLAKKVGLRKAELGRRASRSGHLELGPVGAGESVHVRLRYVHTMEAGAQGYRYVYPFGELPAYSIAAEFDLRIGGASPDEVRVRGYEAQISPFEDENQRGTLINVHQEPLEMTGDLVVEMDRGADTPPLSAQIYVDPYERRAPALLLRVTPPLPEMPRREMGDVLMVFDTSYLASQALLPGYHRLARTLVHELEAKTKVAALSCAQRCEVVGPGWVSGGPEGGRALMDALEPFEPTGAQNTLEALRSIAEIARASKDSRSAGGSLKPLSVVYVTDGHTSLGPLQADAYLDEIATMYDELGVHLHVVDPGGEADRDVQRQLARGLSGTEPVMLEPSLTDTANAWRILERLQTESLRDVKVYLEAAVRLFHTSGTRSFWAGEEMVIVGLLHSLLEDDEIIPLTVTGRLQGQPWEWSTELRPSLWQNPAYTHVPVLVTQGEIAYETSRRSGLDNDRNESIISLSETYGLLSDQTVWKILESRQRTASRREHFASVEHCSIAGCNSPSLYQARRVIRPENSTIAMQSDVKRGRRFGAIYAIGGGLPRGDESSAEIELTVDSRKVRGWGPRETTNLSDSQVESWKEALRIAPTRRELRHQLIKFTSGYTDSGEGEIDRWYAYDPYDPGALRFASQQMAWRGDFERARSVWEDVIDAGPDNLELHEVMARRYTFAGESALACAHRQSVQNLHNIEADDDEERLTSPGLLPGDCPLASDLSVLGVAAPEPADAPPSQRISTRRLRPSQIHVVLHVPPRPSNMDQEWTLPHLIVVQQGRYEVSWEDHPRAIVALERSVSEEGQHVLEAIVELAAGESADLYVHTAQGGSTQVKVVGEEPLMRTLPHPHFRPLHYLATASRPE